MLTFDSLKIWFIRHAESEANLQRIYANEGHSFPFTVNGLQQARAFALRFSSMEIRAVLHSIQSLLNCHRRSILFSCTTILTHGVHMWAYV